MPKLDPADRRLAAFLKSLGAEDELAVRLALRGEFANLRGDRRWTARIDALRDELGLDEDGMARVLRQAEASGEAIRKVVENAASRGPAPKSATASRSPGSSGARGKSASRRSRSPSSGG